MDKAGILKLCAKIGMCIDNVCNTGYTIQISDYRLINGCLKNIEEELAKHGKWISCGERLPKNLQTVIAVCVNHKPESYYSDIKDKPFTAPCIFYNGEWFWWSSNCKDYLAEYGRADFDKVDDAVEITRWMLLPESPEVNEDEAD